MRSQLYKISTAILAIATAFTLSCSSDDGGGGGGGNSSETSGQLTINGLSGANGLYASAAGEAASLLAGQSWGDDDDSPTRAKISDGSVTLKVWKLVPKATYYEITSYSGNDQNVEFSVVIYDSSNPSTGNLKGGATVPVSFSGGKATVTATNVILLP